jgi:hypothetical protein
MMIRSKLAEVGVRLEEAVAGLPEEPSDAQEAFDRWEEMAIQILDGSFQDFDPIELSEYLYSILHVKRMELGLHRDPDIE